MIRGDARDPSKPPPNMAGCTGAIFIRHWEAEGPAKANLISATGHSHAA